MADRGHVLVLGGAGFIGTNACLSALGRGHRVTIADNFSRAGTDWNLRRIQDEGGDRVEVLRGDLADAAFTRRVFERNLKTTAVFHLAGQVAVTTSMADPRRDFEANLLATFNVLEAMRTLEITAPLLFASTNKVYGSQSRTAIRELDTRYEYAELPNGTPESHTLDFHSPYGCSKGASDQYVLDYTRCFGLKGVVFRQSCVYGYHQFGIEDQGWVAWFAISAMLGRPITIFGNGKQVRDVLFIDDLVDAYWRAIERIDVTAGKAYNIGGGRFQMSLLEFVKILERKLGRRPEIRFAESRPGDQKVFVCDTRMAHGDFGWEPRTDIETGLDRLLGWVDANRDALKCLHG